MGRRNFVVICSAGGHLSEAIAAIKYVDLKPIFITKNDEHIANRLSKYKLYYINDPHTSKIGFAMNGLRSLYLLLKTRPKVVLSTGSGIAIPYCLLAKAIGAKLIFIETGARVTTPSRTGQFLYKYADSFYIQWPALEQDYPAAKYRGRLL